MEQRLWLVRLASILVVALFFSVGSCLLVKMNASSRRAQAEEIWEDPRYAPVLEEIKAKHLELKKLRAASAHEPDVDKGFLTLFFGCYLMVGLIVGGYSLARLFISPLFLNPDDERPATPPLP